jgi:hypothetical protein
VRGHLTVPNSREYKVLGKFIIVNRTILCSPEGRLRMPELRRKLTEKHKGYMKNIM